MRKHKEQLTGPFAAMLNHVWPVVLFVCRSKIGSQGDEVDDYLQEVKIRLWNGFVKIGGDMSQLNCKETSFAYTIAERLAKSYMRKKRRHNETAQPWHDNYTDTLECSTFEDDLQRENKDYIYQFIDTLNETDKQIITLDLLGFSNEEIAMKLGLRASGISMRLKRIREKLKMKVLSDSQYHPPNINKE